MKSKFTEIAEQLLKDIEGGTYIERLPSEQELSRLFSTTPMTVRKALDQLLKQGVIEKVPYVGTFVKNAELPVVRIFWPEMPFNPQEHEELKSCARHHFDGRYVLEFSDCGRDDEAVRDYDLIRILGTLGCPYTEIATPFPAESISHFPPDEYFPAAFDVHRSGSVCYALPMLFSPSLLTLDNTMLPDNFSIPETYSLTWEHIRELGRHALEHKLFLWDINAARTLVRCLVLGSCETPGRLADVDLQRMEDNMRMVWPLLSPELIRMPRQQSSKVLLRWTCRQHMKTRMSSGIGTLLAYPPESPGGLRFNVASGEFIMLSNRAKQREAALEVAEFFLSGGIQRIIGRHKTGLPVLKSAAIDSIDSRIFRDDIFLNETRNIIPNNAAEHEFLLRLRSLLDGIVDGHVQLENFIDSLRYEVNMAKNRDNATHWSELERFGLAGI